MKYLRYIALFLGMLVPWKALATKKIAFPEITLADVRFPDISPYDALSAAGVNAPALISWLTNTTPRNSAARKNMTLDMTAVDLLTRKSRYNGNGLQIWNLPKSGDERFAKSPLVLSSNNVAYLTGTRTHPDLPRGGLGHEPVMLTVAWSPKDQELIFELGERALAIRPIMTGGVEHSTSSTNENEVTSTTPFSHPGDAMNVTLWTNSSKVEHELTLLDPGYVGRLPIAIKTRLEKLNNSAKTHETKIFVPGNGVLDVLPEVFDHAIKLVHNGRVIGMNRRADVDQREVYEISRDPKTGPIKWVVNQNRNLFRPVSKPGQLLRGHHTLGLSAP